MTWPAGVAESLYQTGSIPLAMMLEVITPATGEGVAGSVPGWFATSDANLDSFAHILIRDGYRVNLGSAAVVPVSWQYVEGAWSLFVQIPEGRRRAGRLYGALAVQALRRGAMVRLSIGRLGASRSEYYPLKLGRIYAVRSAGHPRTYRVEVWDIQTAFRSRMVATSVLAQERAQLFYGSAGYQDTLAVNYNTGDPTITITGPTTDHFNFETGGAGVVRIESNSHGDWFAKYTAINHTTGVLSGLTVNIFGTVENSSHAGNAATAVCLLEGHPIDILQKILVSTGDGTNGPFDKYPRSWGLAVPQELISQSSFNQAKRILDVTGGTYDWTVLIEAEQADPSTFLTQLFQPAGIWLCVRHGQIVVRVGRDMHEAGLQRQPEDIFDGDLLEVPVVDWYPTDQPQVYFRVVIQNDGTVLGFNRSSTSTLPVKEEIVYNLLNVFRDRSTAHIERIRDDIEARLAPWAHLLPEYIDVTLHGLRSYAPGDVVSFTCGEAFGRLDGTRDGYSNRPVMVIRSAMDINSNSTKLTLATLPIDLQEDGGAT